jgi:hypothetical protein
MNGNRDFIKNFFSGYLQEEGVRTDVQKNTNLLIENLSDLYIDKIDLESIYISGWGTLIIDFEGDNNIFSLEIGSKSIGYFSEINSKTVNFCGESFINTEESLNRTMIQLNSDLLNFYNKIV